ncbi:MAG: carboxymuconolactone decarboxylase family protein [Paracoccaceae bacterium]
MARLEMCPPTPEDPALAALFDGVRARGVEVPNLYRVLAAAPWMLDAWIDFAWRLRLETTTPRALRELMILRGAQLSGAVYEWAHHRRMALDAGVPEAKIAALADWTASDLFTPAERAALSVTEEITAGPGASEAAMTELKAHFAPEAVVELTLTASFYVCVARMLTSLAVDLEPAFEGEAADFPA